VAEIRLEGLAKRFKGTAAIDGVDLQIADGEFFVLLGPSGSGKTTLLRLVAGLEDPDEGSIRIGGHDVTDLPPRKRELAMVFQSYAVFPHMTVADNIGFGLRMRDGADKEELRRRVEEVAGLLEIDQLLDRHPAQLSGGQRQRVAVARAIATEPTLLLMDEPLSNLDALLRLTARAELKKLVQELRTTTLYVTHDQIEALSLGDRVAVMHQGRVVQVDTPMEVYDHPSTRFVGEFIGTPPMNFLRVTAGDRGRVRVGDAELDAPRLDGHDGELLLGIRAEHLEVTRDQAGGSLPAQVQVVEPIGSQLLVTSTTGDQVLKLLTPTDFQLAPGDRLWLRPDLDRVGWFDRDDGTRLAAPRSGRSGS
jgi:multiple sugar transport system ATP-binding protein